MCFRPWGLLAGGVAGAVLTSVGGCSSVELLSTSLTVWSVRVLLTVGAMSAVTRQLVHFLVEVAHRR